MRPPRQVAILTEGRSDPYGAKTANNYVRYLPHEVVGLVDSTQVGKTAQDLFGHGGSIPVVAHLRDLPQADTLLIGISPPGGRLEGTWRDVVTDAIQRGMEILSGLHFFLADDPELQRQAASTGARLVDVRRSSARSLPTGDLDERCLRIHTVGHDCNVGKMVVSFELARALNGRGVSAKFAATGQTGIMLEGDGVPIDSTISDFVAGAAEDLVRQHQHHDVVVVEGQGSLVHPMYSGVTLGLLHGCAPHALIFCLEAGRTHVGAMPAIQLPPLAQIMDLYQRLGGLYRPCPIIGIGLNSRKASSHEAAQLRQELQQQFKLPVCDVVRDGPEDLLQAVLALRQRRPA